MNGHPASLDPFGQPADATTYPNKLSDSRATSGDRTALSTRHLPHRRMLRVPSLHARIACTSKPSVA